MNASGGAGSDGTGNAVWVLRRPKICCLSAGYSSCQSRTAATAKTIETAKSGTNTIRAVRSFWIPTASGTAMSGTMIIGYRPGKPQPTSGPTLATSNT